MKENNKIHKTIVLLLLMLASTGTMAQEKLSPDTLECHMVGFSVGVMTPFSGSSTGLPGGTMLDLYESPYLDFNIDWAYKFADGWMAPFHADLWFGMYSNNLKDRSIRYPHVFNFEGDAIGWGGYSGNVSAYNRGLSMKPGVGYIIRVLPKNPNSGILLKLSGGWMMQKTVYSQEYTEAPVAQLNGDYKKLYDHLRNGVILTESVGFIYMSNYQTYINLKISFELSQCWTWSSRPYQIDNLMGLNGKDKGSYFDLMGGVRITWMFPFTGKTTYDYYYY